MQQELKLLRSRFPNVEYRTEGHWFRIPSYPFPEEWNRTVTDVAFQVRAGYPGTPPYGIYVQAGILFKDTKPDNYVEPASNHPPFEGTWGVFSWTPEDGQWRATNDLVTGSNLLNWVLGFTERFRQGK